jgi:hypothetical protein
MILILLLLITIYLIKNNLSTFGEMIDDLLTYKNKKSDEDFVIMARNKNPEDITVKPYGCFKDIDERFFIRKLNPFSKVKIFNSVFVISENSMQKDFQTLFDEITQNGFGEYALKQKNKNSFTLQELGALCLYAGYSYMSIFKTGLDGNMRIYFSYSPPMNKLNITGQFNQKEYNKYLLKSDLNYSLKFSSSETMCGYPCNSKNPDYYCGSLNYPNIKSPTTFAVYSVS